MDEHSSRPSMFDGGLHIPCSPFSRHSRIKQMHHVPPRDFAAAAAKFRIDFACKLRHIAQASGGKPFKPGEGNSQIIRQRINVTRPVNASVDEHLSDSPIQLDNLSICARGYSCPRLRNLLLHLAQNQQILAPVFQHTRLPSRGFHHARMLRPPYGHMFDTVQEP